MPADTSAAPIEVRGLTKKFGSFAAVDSLSFRVEPGRITGFLGPNGAGKTTTLRMLLGLVRPSAGTGLIEGRRYVDLPSPLGTVGAALEATNFHPGRSGRNHLRVLAATHGIPNARVDELLDLVGIPAAAGKRAGGYSMGMRQRLGLAAALIGDPHILILDEPANGLDPEGIRWMRGLLRHLASEGRTILVSSHLLSEVEQTVDDVVIITNGALVRQGRLADLQGGDATFVRTPQASRSVLGERLQAAGGQVSTYENGLRVQELTAEQIGDEALAAGVAVHELRALHTGLERMYFDLTEQAPDRNRGADAAAATPSAPPPDGPPPPPPSGPPRTPPAATPGGTA